MRAFFILLTLLICTLGFTMDPPAISWVKYYFTAGRAFFYDVHETHDNGFIVAGFKSVGGGQPADSCLFRFSDSGDLLWVSGVEGFTWDIAYWVEELPDSSFILTGATRETAGSSKGLFIQKVDSYGNQLWVKFFDDPSVIDRGNCVLPLADGFAVAGSSGSKAWVIRTDLQGDSLWSAYHVESHTTNARRVLQIDDMLIVFVTGSNLNILAYSIDNGQLLWEADDFPSGFGSIHKDHGDMVLASTDKGFTFVTAYYPNIVHTDSLGNLLWYYGIPYDTQPYSSSISNTMDGGYIYGGVNTVVEPSSSNSAWSGMVVKYDSEGQEQWRDYVYECYNLFSIRQLSTGGYIACGRGDEGTLVRYEPETGIEEEINTSVDVLLTPSPNPFSSTISIHVNLSAPSDIDLSIFDISGRYIENLEEAFLSEGEHTFTWTPQYIQDGRYFIRLLTSTGNFMQDCIYLN